jgi:hypothetical protein
MLRNICVAVVGLALAGVATAQEPAKTTEAADAKKEAAKAAARASIEEAMSSAAAYLVAHQENEREWPYEGVYRVEGKIPVGYRIGGTAICAMAVMTAPGFKGDEAAVAAVERARDFVAAGIDEPLMSIDEYDAGYDVRGWGYTYGLWFLLECQEAGVVSAQSAGAVEKAIEFYLDGILRTEIPEVGGWNYARPPGKGKVGPPSPFMTAPTLVVLFKAAAAGHEVDAEVVKRALEYLESSRASSGAVAYSGRGDKRADGVPGAVGRMLATETTLYLAGRSTQANVRGAVDAFLTHWEWLEKRRAQPGTHVAPYGVAPYYFYFAHYWAAQAVELLPEQEKAEYRRRVHELIFKTRGQDGAWNDRVFDRSACYGTAMVALALSMPESERPAGWPVTGK